MLGEILKEQASPQAERGNALILVEQLSKKFCRQLKRSLFYAVRDIAAEILAARKADDRLRPGEFWALKDVSFQLYRGESLGLIGPNGAGKTTLLRIISGLIKPDTGNVRIRGSVASLIALGAGFNPVLTGRENIYVNCAILGLSREKTSQKFREIEEFADIGDALEAPVQTYSSGMAARLGFACAVMTEPDILLIDEVLAVGDIQFRAKCYRRLAQLRQRGTSFILVSHSPISVLSICDSALYLSRGRAAMKGETESVIQRYQEDVSSGGADSATGEVFLPAKEKTSGIQIRYLGFRDAAGEFIDTPASGAPAYLWVKCVLGEPVEGFSATIIIKDLSRENERVLFLESAKDGVSLRASSGEFALRVEMPCCNLKPGLYSMKFYLTDGKYFHVFDAVESLVFRVKANGGMTQCQFYQPRLWKVLEGGSSFKP